MEREKQRTVALGRDPTVTHQDVSELIATQKKLEKEVSELRGRTTTPVTSHTTTTKKSKSAARKKAAKEANEVTGTTSVDGPTDEWLATEMAALYTADERVEYQQCYAMDAKWAHEKQIHIAHQHNARQQNHHSRGLTCSR